MKKFACILVLSILTLAETGCKKEDDELKAGRPSTWTVNGEVFIATTVRVSEDDKAVSLGSTDASNRFTVAFIMGHFPTKPDYDSLPLTKGFNSENPDSANVNFYYHGKFYKPLQDGVIKTVSSEIIYELPSLWFVNYDDRNDSVLISGTFREP